jgi:hypothetical protein
MKKNGSETDEANNWLAISGIAQQLLDAGMSEVPSDPNGSNDNYWLWTTATNWNVWQYLYMVWKRNWVDNAWFVLMAKTEVEWSSNWVTCKNVSGTGGWYLTSDDDLAWVQLCKTVSKVDSTNTACVSNTDDCYYEEAAELRYILLY